jgi:hypothetical protein
VRRYFQVLITQRLLKGNPQKLIHVSLTETKYSVSISIAMLRPKKAIKVFSVIIFVLKLFRTYGFVIDN